MKWIQIALFTNRFTMDAWMPGCLDAKVKDGIAADYASRGLNMYNKGQYNGKVTKLIADAVKEAKRFKCNRL